MRGRHGEAHRLCTSVDEAAVDPIVKKPIYSTLVSATMIATSTRACLGTGHAPQIGRAPNALIDGNTLMITTLDRLGRSTQNMLTLANELRTRGAGLPVLNLGGGDVDTATPMGSMLFTIMSALAQMEHMIKCEHVTDSISKRSEASQDLGPTTKDHRQPDPKRAALH